MTKNNVSIYFDMDGTLANLYAVEGWLEKLEAFDPTPYQKAAVMLSMNQLARRLNLLKAEGARLYIVSWLSKSSTSDYDKAVIAAKKSWLNNHLHSVSWDDMFFLPYGTPKSSVVPSFDNVSLLFDDEQRNRAEWHAHGGVAIVPDSIISVLEEL